jgi:hypothetical protein
VKRAVSAALAAALMGGCGGGGDDSNGGATAGDTSAQTSPSAPADAALFRSKQIAFTFQYPKGWNAQRARRDQVLGEVSIASGSGLNAIKVRKTADRELGPARYLDEFQHDFARTVGTVKKRTETIGDLDTGVLEFDDSVEQAGESVDFTSTSYFFKGGGRTWQVECIADTEHRDEVAEACRKALESVQFEGKS